MLWSIRELNRFNRASYQVKDRDAVVKQCQAKVALEPGI